MKIYDFQCLKCGTVEEHIASINEIAICTRCMRQAERLFSSPKGGDVSDYARGRFPYYDESLNVIFESSRQKEKYLKEKGLEQIDGAHGIKKRRSKMYF